MRLHQGDRIPEFTFSTAYESDIPFYSVLKGSTVLWVLRYIGCPVCRLDMQDIAKHAEEFEKKNAQVYVVMQSDAEHLKKETADTPLPFTIISDPELKIYDLFEIRPAGSKAAMVGTDVFRALRKISASRKAGFSHGDYEGIEEQLPAMFIVDETGTVTYAHYAKTLVDMPSAEEVLKLL